MTPRPASAIEVRGLCKRFGGQTVLDGVDLDIQRGESVAIIGTSGSGKSVMVKCVLDLIRPDAGSIRIEGDSRVPMERIGVLFQGDALFDSLPVWENIAFSLRRRRGVHRTEARRKALERLSSVGLHARAADLYPSELSGGMRKRVAIARALVTDPAFVFFDEPTAGLDPVTAAVINDLIGDCVDGLGATVVTITHDLSSARRVASRVAMLDSGRIVWTGPSSLLDSSGSEYVEQFVKGRAEGPIRVGAL